MIECVPSKIRMPKVPNRSAVPQRNLVPLGTEPVSCYDRAANRELVFFTQRPRSEQREPLGLGSVLPPPRFFSRTPTSTGAVIR